MITFRILCHTKAMVRVSSSLWIFVLKSILKEYLMCFYLEVFLYIWSVWICKEDSAHSKNLVCFAVALMTCRIRRMQIHMENSPYDRRSKVVLKESIEKRKMKLKYLRRSNYPLFEWILERLNLVYYPPPPYVLNNFHQCLPWKELKPSMFCWDGWPS